jgi:hypothetical protein
MTMSLKMLTAFGLIVLASPAFAHGGGMGGMGHGMGQVTSTNQSVNHQNTKLTSLDRAGYRWKFNKARTDHKQRLIYRIDGKLKSLLSQLIADSEAGNQKGVAEITKQLKILSEQAARNGITAAVVVGGNELTIGKNVQGKLALQGV